MRMWMVDGESSPGGDYHRALANKSCEVSFDDADAFSRSTDQLKSLLQSKKEAFERYTTELTVLTRENAERGEFLPLEQKRALLGGIYDTEVLYKGVLDQMKNLEYLLIRYERIIQNVKEEQQASGISHLFRKLVEQYSALKLTKPGDRLPDLSGICQRIQRNQYLAGIWADSLWLDLLWRADMIEDKPEHTRPTNYRKPAWSWISVEGPVKYWSEIKNLSLELPPPVPEDFGFSVPNRVPSDVRERPRKPHGFAYRIQLAGKNPYGEIRLLFSQCRRIA